MPTKAKMRFRELLKDVNNIDKEVLRLYPTLDFQRPLAKQQVKGLKSALRVLLVAAEQGFVNHFLLEKEYDVGGDSRTRILQQLESTHLLSRVAEMSEKGRTKYIYTLTGRGVLLCAAFPRIFKSNIFASLTTKHVSNKNLASTILVLYLGNLEGRNALLEALHSSSDRLNVENIPEDDLARVLLQAGQKADPQMHFLFEWLEIFIDLLNSDKIKVSEISEIGGTFIEIARSDPRLLKRMLTIFRELMQFIDSTDFQVWASVSKDMKRLSEICLEIVHAHFGMELRKLGDEGFERLLQDSSLLLGELRERLRAETFTRLAAMETQVLKVKKK